MNNRDRKPRCPKCYVRGEIHDYYEYNDEETYIQALFCAACERVLYAQIMYGKPPETLQPWHEVLELEVGATQEEIKAAFRRLVKEHHPDKGGDPRTLDEVVIAYGQARRDW